MSYGGIYVAAIAIGANPNQAVKAFVEAESYDGPSLILSYTHCIAHGYNIGKEGYEMQKKAVASGHWPLYRFDPRLAEQGKNPLQLESKAPTLDFAEFAYGQNRFRSLTKSKPDIAAHLMELAKKDAAKNYSLFEQLSKIQCDAD